MGWGGLESQALEFRQQLVQMSDTQPICQGWDPSHAPFWTARGCLQGPLHGAGLSPPPLVSQGKACALFLASCRAVGLGWVSSRSRGHLTLEGRRGLAWCLGSEETPEGWRPCSAWHPRPRADPSLVAEMAVTEGVKTPQSAASGVEEGE